MKKNIYFWKLWLFLYFLTTTVAKISWGPRMDVPYEDTCWASRPPELLKAILTWTLHASLLENNDRLSLTLNKAK